MARKSAEKGEAMPERAFELRAEDGARIFVRQWRPEGAPKAVVLIVHGLAEHSGRYATFAGALNAAGYAAYANDLRGHGPGERDLLGHFADRDGWRKVLGDVERVRRRIAVDCPGAAIVLFGHSMGSFLVQDFVAAHAADLAGVVYCASNGPPPALAKAGRWIARAERLRVGPRGKSALLNKMMFGDFNKGFQPARTRLDWLSRDEQQVDAYLADPFCGFPFTTQLAVDLLDALPGLLAPERLARLPKTLPIYVMSGERDPVGPNVAGLIEALKDAGLAKVAVRLYKDARHELLNETNREEVVADVIRWLDGVVSS
jgi:alpha-beta hydrolase superfamily lysophospholipase